MPRKRDGVVKKAPKKPRDYKKLNTDSVAALQIITKPKSKEDEAALFATTKATLLHATFHRAVYSVISQYHQSYIDWYPDHPKSYERQGYSQYELGNYMKAIERLGQAIYLGASSGKVWRTLGKACYLQWERTHAWGLLWDAKKCYEYGLKYLEVATSPFVMLELLQVFEGLGDFPNALGTARTLLFTYPQFKLVDRVIYHAVVLMFQRIVFQQIDVTSSDGKELLEQCCEYCKFIIDKDIAKTEWFVDVLYITARVHETLGISRTVKYAAKTYEELYRVALRQHLFTPLPGKNWADWFQDESTWKTWVDYFDARHCYILCVDATQEALKRIKIRRWNMPTFAWEPDATLWLQLGVAYFKCNAMVPAVAAATTAFYFGHYREDIRAKLLEWYPDHWRPLLECEAKSQVIIASLLRGVWGRDAAKQHKANVIAASIEAYATSPYSNLRARKVLLRYRFEKYAPKFAAQDLAARTLQRASRHWLPALRAYYSHKANCDHRLLALERKLSCDPFDRLVRHELGALSPMYRALFAAQVDAATIIQRVYWGAKARSQFRLDLAQKRLVDAELLRRTRAASTIQRRVRYIRGHAILRTRQIWRQRRARLAVNLQRLYRKKHSRMAQFLRHRAKLKADEARYQLHRHMCIRIQTWWRRHLAFWTRDEPLNEAQFLLERLLRGHETLMHDERDLDFYARKIQAIYRGRRARINLKGLTRRRVPPPPSITATLRVSLPVASLGVVRDGMVVGQIRHLFEVAESLVLEPRQPLQHDIYCANLAAALAASAPNIKTILAPAGCLLRDEGLGCLVEAMRTNQLKNLRVLAIGANDIRGDVPFRALATCVQTAHFQLRELILEDNAMNLSGVLHVASAMGDFFFGRYGHLTRVVLGRAGVTDAACDAIGKALAINTVLKRLELPGNKIRDAGASLLATGLQQSRSLHLLDLSDNSIGSLGGLALCECLPSSQLRVLLLRNNNLQNDVVPRLRLLLALPTADHVECLDVRGNLIHDDHVLGLTAHFPPQSSEYYIVPEALPPLVLPSAAFDAAKLKLLRQPATVRATSKPRDALQALRHAQRTRPLGGYRNAETTLLQRPRLPPQS
ncbi:hypothetical protein SDRG_02104 [Saprolegnia diclina VS20]|uniref:Uncharacterized protein n=1 Tax=Saprolegnia diclina (strain VS20) TaxID=1156394 RepID=T0S7J2_SAPDV|nr:hypothetical protein SDRG_02104 [Saprolegnia diclina VS20]EQC41048.1 hypothetical protein SDRG_02104 [Saprolegnia diclina VS20]|eukprot:XP_008605892.1 hypothetical protein SDRG_02104 [Saprolegnia diclina VS20]